MGEYFGLRKVADSLAVPVAELDAYKERARLGATWRAPRNHRASLWGALAPRLARPPPNATRPASPTGLPERSSPDAARQPARSMRPVGFVVS